MARKLGGKGAAPASPRRGRKAGNGSGAAPPPAAQSNITDETFQQLCLEALKKKTEHEKKVDDAKSANAEYRAVLKRAKKLGIMPEVIIIWLNDRKLEVGDVNSRLARIVWLITDSDRSSPICLRSR